MRGWCKSTEARRNRRMVKYRKRMRSSKCVQSSIIQVECENRLALYDHSRYQQTLVLCSRLSFPFPHVSMFISGLVFKSFPPPDFPLIPRYCWMLKLGVGMHDNKDEIGAMADTMIGITPIQTRHVSWIYVHVMMDLADKRGKCPILPRK